MPQVHLVIIHGDEEIRSVQAFATHASALACRNTFVREHWDQWMGGEPLAEISDEAFERLHEVTAVDGLCLTLVEVEIEQAS
jgi:hypothetical protein